MMNKDLIWKKVHYLMDRKLDPMDDESIQAYLADHTDDLEDFVTMRARLDVLKTAAHTAPLKPVTPLTPIIKIAAIAAVLMLLLIWGFTSTDQQQPVDPQFIVLNFCYQERITCGDHETIWSYDHGERTSTVKTTINIKEDKTEAGPVYFSCYEEEIRSSF